MDNSAQLFQHFRGTQWNKQTMHGWPKISWQQNIQAPKKTSKAKCMQNGRVSGFRDKDFLSLWSLLGHGVGAVLYNSDQDLTAAFAVQFKGLESRPELTLWEADQNAAQTRCFGPREPSAHPQSQMPDFTSSKKIPEHLRFRLAGWVLHLITKALNELAHSVLEIPNSSGTTIKKQLENDNSSETNLILECPPLWSFLMRGDGRAFQALSG